METAPKTAPKTPAQAIKRIKDFEDEKARLMSAYQLALRAFWRTKEAELVMDFYGFKSLVFSMSMVFNLDFSYDIKAESEDLSLLFSLEDKSLIPVVVFSGHDKNDPFMQGMNCKFLDESQEFHDYRGFRTVCGKIAHVIYLLRKDMDVDFAFIYADKIKEAIESAEYYAKRIHRSNYERMDIFWHDSFLKARL